MADGKYFTVDEYRVVRMPLTNFTMSLPIRNEDGSVGARTLYHEKIRLGDQNYLCFFDRKEKVVYIANSPMEEPVESSCRCGKISCCGGDGEAECSHNCSEALTRSNDKPAPKMVHGERCIHDRIQKDAKGAGDK